MTPEEMNDHMMAAMRQLNKALGMPIVIVAFPFEDQGLPAPIAVTSNLSVEDVEHGLSFAAEMFRIGDNQMVSETPLGEH